MPFERLQDVANDYESLLTNTNIVKYDVIIYAGNNNRKIYAHSFVLRTRSRYFRTRFSNGSVNRRNGKFIFNLPNITPQLFNMILRFIYCGKIDLDQLAGSVILNLLMAVDEINIQRLIDYIQEYLIKNRDNYVQHNSIEILERIHQNNAFIVLRDICIKKICEDPQRLFNSSSFNSLNAPLLELLFDRDDLPLHEIVIWNNLIRWCRAQHSSIPQDPTQWSIDEITIMERTIHRFVPLIRFCHISPENFANNVYPFREIMPNNLVNRMVQFNMTRNQKFNDDRRPPRSNIDSVIIDQNHIAVFANWIYRRNKSYGYIPYKFNLLYRASRDSKSAAVFHRKCDNRGATLTVVKIAGSNQNQIVGGYSSLSWDSSGAHKNTNDSFIFSFANRNDHQNARVGYCNSNSHSIYCCSFNGPVFGRGGDLGYHNGVWYCHENHSYPNVGIPLRVFNMDDYEVFQVVNI